MKAEFIVAIVSGAVALLVAGISLWGTLKVSDRTTELEKFKIEQQQLYEAKKEEAKYKEPLLRAAYELQSRLYNILKQNLVAVYLTGGNDRERSYVIDNTTFVVSQYFAWTEITRDEIQFINLRQDTQTSQLSSLLDTINHLWLTDEFPKPFRVFAGEQRAIGEVMEEVGPDGVRCMGYGTFLGKVLPNGDKLIESLRADVAALPTTFEAAQPRLIALQHALIDLLDFLDPAFIRFRKEHRTRV